MHTAFPVNTEADHRRALALVDELWDAAPGSPEAELLDVMASLVDAYEKRTRALPPPDPLELLAFKLRELGWSQRELGRRLGWGSGRVSEVLSGKRALTLGMVRELSTTLDLPPGLLVHDTRTDAGDSVWVRVPRAVADRAARVFGEPDLDRLVTRLLQEHGRPAPLTVVTSTPSVGARERVGPAAGSPDGG